MQILTRTKNWWLPIVVVLLGVGVFQYLKATKPKALPVEVEERAWTVESMQLTTGDWSPQQVLYGQVVSSQRVKVSAPITAQVAHIYKREGETFEAGEVLLRLDETEVRLSRQTAAAEYEEAKALLAVEKAAQAVEVQREQQEAALFKLAKAEYQRNVQLKSRSMVSDSVVDKSQEAMLRQESAWINAKLLVEQHQAKLSQLQARLLKAQSNDERAQLNAQRATVIAPYAGRVVKLSVSEGDQVVANAELMQYDGFEHLEVRAVLPHRHRDAVEQALNAGLALQARLETLQQSYRLPLRRFGGEALKAGVEVVFTLPTNLAYLRPGVQVVLALDLPMVKHGFAVPFTALYGQDKVYVIEDDRLVARRVSLIGEVARNGESWALIQGELVAGDRLMMTHLPNAVSGLRILSQSIRGGQN